MATVPAAGEHLEAVKPSEQRDTEATDSGISSGRGLAVAVFDQNKTLRDRILHPGPLNIVACLEQHCWDGCAPPDPQGATKCNHSGASPVAKVHLVTPALIRQGVLKGEGFDVVVFPGGSAKTQAKALQPKGMLAVRQFVENGGGYVRCSERTCIQKKLLLKALHAFGIFLHVRALHFACWCLLQVGICAGAFLALAHYGRDRSLKLLDAHTVLPWKRGQAVLKHAFSPVAADLLLGLPPGSIGATAADHGHESPIDDTNHGDIGPSQSISWTATPSTYGDGGTRCVQIRYHNGPLMMSGPRPPRWGRQERIFDTECVPDSACAAPPGAIEMLAVFMEDACSGKPVADEERGVQTSADQDPLSQPQAAEPLRETQVGKGAIVRGLCGRGRVLLISSHPESTQNQAETPHSGNEGNTGEEITPISLSSGHDAISAPAQKTAAKALGAAGYGRIIHRAVAWAGGR